MKDFEKLGPYLVKDKLGQGGMGAVYRGEHVQSGQAVAIKVIAPQIANQARFRRRFSAEIETLKRLNHPNIVGLIGYGEEQGHLFYSMQLVDGPSLQQHLRKVKRMQWQQVVQYGIDICGALKHAHDMGVTHRDLKPGNLLISGGHFLKLTDFGIAKLWRGDEMTAVGAMLGTADYMAPEQANGGAITPRTDLYSLGSVMYACLTGRPPFAGTDLPKVLNNLQNTAPAPIDLIVTDLPDQLADVIHRLLEKSPADRPPTALATGNLLRSVLQSPAEMVPYDEIVTTETEQYSIDITSNDPSQLDLRAIEDVPTDQRVTLTPSQFPDAGEFPLGDDETIDATVPAFVSVDVPGSQTHFRTVDQEERRRAINIDETVETSPRPAEQILSIAALIGVLCLVIGGAIWLVRPQSADTIYNAIKQAEYEGELEHASAKISEFLARYPDDPRNDEISSIADRLDTDRVLKRLRMRARIQGGVEQLGPAEQTFLKAMKLREENPNQAHQLMEQWLNVYSHADRNDKEIERLVPIVRQEMAPLRSAAQTKTNDQEVALRAWVDDSLERLPQEQIEEFLIGVIALYSEDAWAKDIINDCQQKLDALRTADTK